MGQIGVVLLILVLGTVGVAIYSGTQSTAPDISNATSSIPRFISILRRDYLSEPPSSARFSPGVGITTYPPSSGQAGYQPAYRLSPNQSELSKKPEKELYATTTPVQNRSFTPPSGFTAEDLSPFYRKVVIASIGLPRSYAGVTSLSLIANLQGREALSITGWRIKVGGADIVIPSAIPVYDPKSLRSGEILLESGHAVSIYGHYIYGYRHPFGKNLRLNACVGYLNNLYEFNPKLPKRCPRIDRNEILSLSGKCQSFLTSFSSCYEPTNEDVNTFMGDSSCQAHMRSLVGYANCFSRHQDDENFLSNEWYVWLDKQIPFDDEHGRVALYDKQDRLVDVYIY